MAIFRFETDLSSGTIMEKDILLAIITAAVMEENRKKPEFGKTTQNNKLNVYLRENNIIFHKYQLGDENL